MLYQPIYDSTSPEGLVFFTGNPDQFFSHNPILQETCKRIDLMITQHRKTLVTRFRLPFPSGFDPGDCDAKVEQYFNLIEYHADIFGLVTHYVWVKEQVMGGYPIYHAVVLVNDDKPFRDVNFISEVEDAWRWVTGRHYVDLDIWCYDNDIGEVERNLLTLEQSSLKSMSQEGHYRAHFDCCLWWAQRLAEVYTNKRDWRGTTFGMSQLR